MRECYHNLMRTLGLTAIVTAAGMLGLSHTAIGSSVKSGLPAEPQRETVSNPTPHTGPVFPTLYGVQQTGKVNGAFDAFGCFGLGFSRFQPNIAEWPSSSFETPPGSGLDYLFGGAIWVGGIVNGDTLVSVGADGWQNTGELYPTPYTSTNHVGTVTEAEPVGDYAFRAECSDTVHLGITYQNDFPSQRPYQPLSINVATRSEVWHGAPQDNCILYDVVITNVGSQTIHQGYVGLYMDADVGSINDLNKSTDDVTGSIRDSGIAYIIDNNGDFATAAPALGAFACQFLWSSWGATDTNYNWWISNMSPSLDFGPRLRPNLRDFGIAGGLGTPEGDANKYYVMSHPEWDYDQVKIGTTGLTDTLWTYPSALLAQMLSKGYDTRFLLSLGHFELPPDSSIRFIFATYIADSVHTSASNGTYITDPDSYNPDAYLAGLNFAKLNSNAGIADSLAGLLLAPEDPVQGLRVEYNSHDTVVVTWDDWCASNIDGYNIYLAAIPDSPATLAGQLPRSARSLMETPFAQIGRTRRYLITGVNPDSAYLCTVAHRTGSTVGEHSSPLIFRFDSGSPTDVTTTDPSVPTKFNLDQNYPNPFNPSTTISFTLSKREHVTLDIYNVVGQKVASLVDGDFGPGTHRAVWDGSSARHGAAASGIYFYRLHAGDQVATKKMLLLK